MNFLIAQSFASPHRRQCFLPRRSQRKARPDLPILPGSHDTLREVSQRECLGAARRHLRKVEREIVPT
jgi:hypothetical protein